jgi:PAS domain-containing protein
MVAAKTLEAAMKVRCSYCHRSMGEIEPLEDPQLSHGMCRDCLEHFAPQWEGLKLDDYLARFSEATVILDADRRLLAANQAGRELLGRDPEGVRGLLPGEFMECEHARLPEGCGKAEHCASCGIHRCLGRAAAIPGSTREIAWLKTDAGPLRLRLEAERVGGLLRLTVERAG